MADIIQYISTGRRKNSVARVRMMPGEGKVVVNKRPFENFFPREVHRLIILQPMELIASKLTGKFDIHATVHGGGNSGQAGAMRQGIARTLVKIDGSLKDAVKKAGFLTRDSRMRERKKYGRKRARRRFQFSKR